jgi:predicted RNase H-like HicB family nuclease
MIYDYLIVIEETGTGFAAYSPDVLGCIATGATREQVEREMREALEFHIEGMRLEGLPIPRPHSYSKLVEVAA